MTLHPSTVVLDGFRLTEARKRLRQGTDSALQTALEALTKQADQWLTQGPWSVTMKTVLPPSGDKHDYTSLARYWWPNPDSPDGKPYINRDGKKNPEVLNYTDRVYWEKLIPYANTGRCIGIIDLAQAYTSLLDAAAILAYGTTEAQGPGITPSRAPGWTDVDVEVFRRWNVDFLEWLTDSPFGREERAQSNNHGSFAAMQIAAIALFLGDTDRARNEVLAVRAHLRDTIAPDGSQPEELRRTRSWHYSTFNLLALTRLACVGQKLGVDLWKFAGPGGEGNISRAVDFIIPVATGSGSWPYPELGFKAYAAADIIRTAATAGHQRAKEALGLLQMPPAGDLWPLRPAPEQLDGVVVDEYSK
ncbi:hypothetical protein PMG11_01243 [Penicillium brasilianum]|uniref:Alginate lyase domain-containing protein n=1 Tax=Penicillium brasilianum TaxID=104259 RepID=A0A0F7TGG5_PENBI|nr:hypothetical protein PMG11_01243 [Penicillium brasilianum]